MPGRPHRPGSKSQTTPLSQDPSQIITITHPYHPRCGQQVEIIRKYRGEDPDIIVQTGDGLRVVVAMSWTDYAVPLDSEALSYSPPHLLDFFGLLRATKLIEHLRQEERFPQGGTGEEACHPGDQGYDQDNQIAKAS
ncbi:MAG: hypothetical protein HN413_13835 [Chloroflexi bacterium]|jgi:hypothetical protein|nr:hypothetical protein [Chloroflexota bacterium]